MRRIFRWEIWGKNMEILIGREVEMRRVSSLHAWLGPKLFKLCLPRSTIYLGFDPFWEIFVLWTHASTLTSISPYEKKKKLPQPRQSTDFGR
jgi:hypothetical protein